MTTKMKTRIKRAIIFNLIFISLIVVEYIIYSIINIQAYFVNSIFITYLIWLLTAVVVVFMEAFCDESIKEN